MISFKGFDEKVLTFEGSEVTAGYPISLTDSGAVNAPNTTDFIGVCTGITDSKHITAQVSGYVELPYTGEAPKVGYAALVSNGNGGIKASSSGKIMYKVLKVDTDNSIVGIIL